MTSRKPALRILGGGGGRVRDALGRNSRGVRTQHDALSPFATLFPIARFPFRWPPHLGIPPDKGADQPGNGIQDAKIPAGYAHRSRNDEGPREGFHRITRDPAMVCIQVPIISEIKMGSRATRVGVPMGYVAAYAGHPGSGDRYDYLGVRHADRVTLSKNRVFHFSLRDFPSMSRFWVRFFRRRIRGIAFRGFHSGSTLVSRQIHGRKGCTGQ